MKFFSVSLDLLAPVHLIDIDGKTYSQFYLYYDGTIAYLGKEHLPYAILAFSVILVVNILPLLLLCLYPYRKFQKCLNHHRLNCQALHTFMAAFQGCYKDGTNSSCDCRWFVTLHLMIRSIFVIVTTVTTSNFWLPLSVALLLVLLLFTAILRPYKVPAYSIIDISLLGSFVLGFIIFTVQTESFRTPDLSKAVPAFGTFVPFVYFAGVILYKFFSVVRCVREACQKLWVLMPCRWRAVHADLEGSLPDRIAHPEQYAALLAESV